MIGKVSRAAYDQSGASWREVGYGTISIQVGQHTWRWPVFAFILIGDGEGDRRLPSLLG